MRLTERKTAYPKCNKQGKLTKVDYIEIKDKKLAEEKLCQLEDVEEELGIDLITLFKALKKGIYIKKQSEKKYPLALLRRHYTDHTTKYFVIDYGKEKEIKLKNYGKTWALTKEELL